MLYGLCGYGDHHNARKWYVWSKINVIPKTNGCFVRVKNRFYCQYAVNEGLESLV